MKLRLSTWNILLLGSSFIAANYLFLPTTKNDPGGRALAIGVLFYLVIPVIILLVVDGMKIYQYYRGKN